MVTTPVNAVAEEQLVREHLQLVTYGVAEVVNRIPRHVSRDDLESAAMLGLAQAARAFDPTRGVAFDRFAMLRIRGALLDELRGKDWASRSVRARARKLERAADALTARHQRTPTTQEVAAEAGFAVEDARRLADDLQRATVLNYESFAVDGGIEDLLEDDAAAPEETVLDRERRGYLVDAIVSLPERLRAVVVGSFIDERPLHAIADDLGVSESRVSQMRTEAVALLREAIDANLNPELLRAQPRPDGRLARRKAAYYAAVAAASTARDRLSADAANVHARIAALAALAA